MDNEEKTEQIKDDAPKKKKNFFLKHLWDFVLLSVLLVGTSSVYIARAVSKKKTANQDIIATVLYEGETMEILDAEGKNLNPFDLSKINDYEEIEIKGRHTSLTLGLKHNAVCVVKSACPGQECVHEGWVSEANHPIICAHNGIYIEVTTNSWSDISQG